MCDKQDEVNMKVCGLILFETSSGTLENIWQDHLSIL